MSYVCSQLATAHQELLQSRQQLNQAEADALDAEERASEADERAGKATERANEYAEQLASAEQQLTSSEAKIAELNEALKLAQNSGQSSAQELQLQMRAFQEEIARLKQSEMDKMTELVRGEHQISCLCESFVCF